MKLRKNINQNKEIRAMAYHTTILLQIIEIFPRHEFDALAKDNHRSQKLRPSTAGPSSCSSASFRP